MNRLRFVFLMLGAIALTQSPAIATDINFGGVTIPSQQTLPPATAKDIAFRPACNQLIPIRSGNRVFWTVTMSDGDRRELAAYKPMGTQEAHFWLDAEGVCKIGGVEVPLVYVDQVPQRQVAQVTTTPELPAGEALTNAGQNVQTVTPQSPSESPDWLPMAIGAPILLFLGWLFVSVVRGGDRRHGQRQAAPKAQQGHDNASALNDIFGGGQQ